MEISLRVLRVAAASTTSAALFVSLSRAPLSLNGKQQNRETVCAVVVGELFAKLSVRQFDGSALLEQSDDAKETTTKRIFLGTQSAIKTAKRNGR